MQDYSTSSIINNKDQPIYKVMIAEDHDIFRHGLKNLLNKYSFIKCSGEACNGKELLKLVQKDPPHLIFMDLHMPGGHGMETTEEIIKKYPDIKIIVLSFLDDAITIERMLKIGVVGYLTKNISLELMDDMFERVLNGKTYLCPVAKENFAANRLIPTTPSSLTNLSESLDQEISIREKDVLKKLVQGMVAKEIATELGISPRTAEVHKSNLMKKLGARNTAELIAIAYKYNLV